jgi:hypothetical protein
VSDRNEFAKRSEDLVKPEDVAFFSLFGGMLGWLPLPLQKAVVPSKPGKAPPMGFVVEPYAFFTCHELTDVAAAQALIPDDYVIVPTRVFAADEPRPTVIFGAFSVHASGFAGQRVEMYVIAQSKSTGMRSWVIVDFDSNALSFDPGQGFVTAGAERCVVTTTHRGTVLVDVVGANRRIAVEAELAGAAMEPLDRELWLEGNLSVAYGGGMGDGSDTPLGLVFEPEEMAQALRMPLDRVAIEELSWHPELYEAEPYGSVCFPYAQHFVTSTLPLGLAITDEAGLRQATHDIATGPVSRGYSAKPIRLGMTIYALAFGAVSLAAMAFTALTLLG